MDARTPLPSSTAYEPTRRQAIAAGGSALAATVGAVGLASQADPVAAVDVDTFSVESASFETAEASPVAQVAAAYRYQLRSPAESVRVYLLVSGDPIDDVQRSVSVAQKEGTVDLSGSLTDASRWAASDFTVSEGESVEHTVGLELALQVRRGGATVVEDRASTSTTVSVTHPNEVTVVGEIGGSGVIVDGS